MKKKQIIALSLLAVLVASTTAFAALRVFSVMGFSGKGEATVNELALYDSVDSNEKSTAAAAFGTVTINGGDAKLNKAGGQIAIRGTGVLTGAVLPSTVYAFVGFKQTSSAKGDCTLDFDAPSASCTDLRGYIIYYNLLTAQKHGTATVEADSDSLHIVITDPVSGDVLADVEAPIDQTKVRSFIA